MAKRFHFTPAHDQEMMKAVAQVKCADSGNVKWQLVLAALKSNVNSKVSWGTVLESQVRQRYKNKLRSESNAYKRKKIPEKRKIAEPVSASRSSLISVPPLHEQIGTLKSSQLVHPFEISGPTFAAKLKKEGITLKEFQKLLLRGMPILPDDWKQKIINFNKPVGYDDAVVSFRRKKNAKRQQNTANVAVFTETLPGCSTESGAVNVDDATTEAQVTCSTPIAGPSTGQAVASEDPCVLGPMFSTKKQMSAPTCSAVRYWENRNPIIRIPSGYSSQHPMRLLVDDEWRKILSFAYHFSFQFEHSDETDWRNMLLRTKISTTKSPLEVKRDFFKFAAPKMYQLMEFNGEHVQLLIEDCNEFACITIFSGAASFEITSIVSTIQDFVQQGTLSTARLSVEQWKSNFITLLTEESHEFFHATSLDHKNAKRAILTELLTRI